MTSRTRSALSLTVGEPDQVKRLERFDASRPNMGRVYDYWLGGKDNYAADREEAERLLEIYPQHAHQGGNGVRSG